MIVKVLNSENINKILNKILKCLLMNRERRFTSRVFQNLLTFTKIPVSWQCVIDCWQLSELLAPHFESHSAESHRSKLRTIITSRNAYCFVSILTVFKSITMTSTINKAFKISSSQLHEQMIELRLHSEDEIIDDSNLEDYRSNHSISSISHIKIVKLEHEIQFLRKKNQQISRLRALRSRYRQKTHQLREEIISLRAQLHQQQNDELLIDSDHEEHTQRQQSDLQQSDRQQPDVLHLDSHSFNRVVDSALFFVKSVSQSEFTDSSSQSLMILKKEQSRLKYSDVDYFYDDRDKWNQWRTHLKTKIWTCKWQFSIEQHKINYTRDHIKSIAFDIIEIRVCFDSNNPYLNLDEMLQNLKYIFDDDDNTKRNNVYNKLFSAEFVMKNNETLVVFLARYINTVTPLVFFNYDMLFHLERNLTHRLRKSAIAFFTIIKNYHTFVQQLRVVNSRHQTMNQTRFSEYSKSNSLTRKKKKHLDNIEDCYKCHQSRHKTSDKDASCKRTSWMLKNAEHWWSIRVCLNSNH